MARLIDSSVFIALERRGESLTALDKVLLGEPFALASISASELLIGVMRSVATSQRKRRQDFVESVLSRVPILPFGLDSARIHARLSVELAAAGQSIGHNDLLIAATALTVGYDVVTHNVRHFARVPGLVVQRPDW